MPNVWWRDTDKSGTSGSNPILLRVSQFLLSVSGKLSGGQGLESVDLVEKQEVEWREGQRVTKADLEIGLNLPEVHIKKGIDIESALSEV